MHRKEYKPTMNTIVFKREAQLQVWHPAGKCIKHGTLHCSECKKIVDNDLVMIT